MSSQTQSEALRLAEELKRMIADQVSFIGSIHEQIDKLAALATQQLIPRTKDMEMLKQWATNRDRMEKKHE